MSCSIRIDISEDGTVTVTVGKEKQTCPDLVAAAEWATDKAGDEDG